MTFDRNHKTYNSNRQTDRQTGRGSVLLVMYNTDSDV